MSGGQRAGKPLPGLSRRLRVKYKQSKRVTILRRYWAYASMALLGICFYNDVGVELRLLGPIEVVQDGLPLEISGGRVSVEFRLLGLIEVVQDGLPLEISGGRQQVVLAMMLLDVNRLLPTSRLVDALWDERPPTTAKSQVQICVSALRRQLATVGRAEAICTRTSGYILRTDEDEVDVKRFERLAARGGAGAAQGRNEDALRDLKAALDCWHASAAAAGVQSRIVQAAAARLNEQRLAVVEECLELELAQGRTHDLVGELSELVAEHPLRERLRTQHMIALYRSAGRSRRSPLS